MEPLVVIILVVGGFFLMFADKDTMAMIPVAGMAIALLATILCGISSLFPPHVNPYRDYTVKVERRDVNPAEVENGNIVAILTGPRGTVDYYRKADH
jgi:hypothetical protein